MEKSPDAFRTISEVADELGLPQHVLRFWETKFSPIRPVKRAGGRRFYRPEDVDLLRGIQQLLYGQGYTIKGVQKILKDQGVRHVQDIGIDADGAPLHSSPPEEPPPRRQGRAGGALGGLLGLIPGRKAQSARQEDEEPRSEPSLPFAQEGSRPAGRQEPAFHPAQPVPGARLDGGTFEDPFTDPRFSLRPLSHAEPDPEAAFRASDTARTGARASATRMEPRFEAGPSSEASSEAAHWDDDGFTPVPRPGPDFDAPEFPPAASEAGGPDPLLPFLDEAPPPVLRRQREEAWEPAPPARQDIPSPDDLPFDRQAGAPQPHLGPFRVPPAGLEPEEVEDEMPDDDRAWQAAPSADVQRGPPEQYLPPHLRSEPRLAPSGPVPVLSREDLNRLQASLNELAECRRLLTQALDSVLADSRGSGEARRS